MEVIGNIVCGIVIVSVALFAVGAAVLNMERDSYD